MKVAGSDVVNGDAWPRRSYPVHFPAALADAIARKDEIAKLEAFELEVRDRCLRSQVQLGHKDVPARVPHAPC
jgi:hypothetical protein